MEEDVPRTWVTDISAMMRDEEAVGRQGAKAIGYS
jgi:hypothetical protein